MADPNPRSVIELPTTLCEAMVAHSAATSPLEACGVLSADRLGRWSKFFALPNAARSAMRFVMEPAPLYEVIQMVEMEGGKVAGFFHSHPNGSPVPSKLDIALWPDRTLVSFICAPASSGWEVTAYRLEGAGPVGLALRWRPTAGLNMH